MTEGQFDQHFMEIFATGDIGPRRREQWAPLVLAAVLLAATAGGLLLA